MDTKLDVLRLGNCIDLWNQLDSSPRCTYGNFRLNFSHAKKLVGDDATLSDTTKRLINNFFYKDNNKHGCRKNPDELYSAGADVDMVFDPLSLERMNWGTMESPEKTTKGFTIKEIQISLQANAQLQRRLVESLKEKQKEYAVSWTHFHTRLEDFWKIAQEVCMGDQTSEAWFVQIEAEILDAFFFVNPENRRGYLEYICGSYDPKKGMNSLRRKLQALNKQLNRGNPGSSDWRSNMFVQVDEIVKVWGELRINEENRTDFQTPILREFAHKMNEIDSLIFNGAGKENLLQLVQADSSNSKIAERVQKIRELLDEAIKLWGEFQEKI